MRIRARWGAAVVVAVAGLAIAGDEPKTYDIDAQERWKAKQVVTYTVHQSSEFRTTMGGNPMKSNHVSVDAVYVLRCDEAAADGSATKTTVFVKSWKATDGTGTDESLTGALVAVTDNEWKIDGGKPASSVAKKWLDKRFGKNRIEDPLEKVAPKQLTIGQPWKSEPKVVAEAFGKSLEDTPIDPSGATMDLVLESAQGTPPDATGKISVKVHLPITKVKNMPPNAALRDTSGIEVNGWRTGPLTKATMLVTSHTETNLSIEVDMPTPQGGMTISTKAKFVEDQDVVAGGEIPAPAEPVKPAVPDKK